mmetsp:Transcript_20844/g.39136  ORF Transcript_20844/g.39136 Transcript_20844/m.39136 type:complete len:221 (+) Transcript_20844:83-745(+)
MHDDDTWICKLCDWPNSVSSRSCWSCSMPCIRGVRLPPLPPLEEETRADEALKPFSNRKTKSKPYASANKDAPKAAPHRRAKRMRRVSLASCSRKKKMRGFPDVSLSSMERLPDVIRLYMCTFMYPKAIVSVGVTCKRLYLFMQTQHLWHMLSKRIWHLRCPPGCKRDHNWRVAYRTRMRSFRKGKVHLCPFCTCKASYVKRERLLKHLSGHDVYRHRAF